MTIEQINEQIKRAKYIQEQKIIRLKGADHQADILNLTGQIQSKGLLIRELESLKSELEYKGDN